MKKQDKQSKQETKAVLNCPYCKGTKIVKKGTRQKKHEIVQLYYCKYCTKKFTPLSNKNLTTPLNIVIDAITRYNKLATLEQSAKIVSEKYGIKISPQNIKNWLEKFSEYLPFERMRDFINKKYKPREAIVETKLFHGQIYDFKYHRAKTDLILQENFKHYKFRPLRDFLELIIAECPHQVFQESKLRASEYKNIFNLDEVRIVPKENRAVHNSRFVIQAVANNKLRHEILQDFMLANDSVTVATEIPILLEKDDLLHYQNELGFDLGKILDTKFEDNDVITGHIDLIQIRNGVIHIMDYKPSAKKVKPIEQLTIYALALSRLTTLRMFHFKCAWFDDENYYEFFPLHVVWKKKKKKKKRKKK